MSKTKIIDASRIEYGDILAFHPGCYLKELIDDMEITQDEFAKRVGTSPKHLSNVLAGSASLSENLAMKLSIMLGTSAGLWLNLQAKYEEKCIEIEEEKKLEEEKEYAKMIQYKYFAALGVVPEERRVTEKIKNLCKYFKISSLSLLSQEHFLVDFRNNIENPNIKNRVNSNAWLQTAINIGKEIDVAPYDKKKLESKIPEIRTMTIKDPQVFYPRLNEIFKSCGVAFVTLPHLPSSGIHGAVKWYNDQKVLLAISDRLKSSDIFWFSLFHEIKHVLQRRKTMTIVTEDSMSQTGNLIRKLEAEADEFARETLIPRGKYLEYVQSRIFTEQSIKRFAEMIDVHPGIVLGRLQKDKYVHYSKFNYLKTKYTIIFT